VTRVVAIIGSATPPGRLRRAVGDAVERLVGGHEVDASVIDLAELRLAFADGRRPEAFDDDTAATVNTIWEGDAIAIATPVYRGSLSGSLKNLIDQTPVEALRGKPTAIIAMGASQHHYLGADRHLRDILTFFGALVTPVSVYLTSADFIDGAPSEEAAAELDLLLANLVAMIAAASAAPEGPAPLGARRGPPRPAAGPAP
jgi:FMN reductase